MAVDKIVSYALACVKLALTRPDCFRPRPLARHFPAWWTSVNAAEGTLATETPWICFAAIEYLEKLVTKEMHVFEFGSGGSTLFFARRAKEVSSVEHDPQWFEKVLAAVQIRNTGNCSVVLHEPEVDGSTLPADPANPDDYASAGEIYRGMKFEKYASSIDRFPDEYFDVVLIDGRSRPSCFKHSLAKVKKGGCLILDNAERKYYSGIHETMAGLKWKKVDFYGPLPLVRHFSETCIWIK